MKIVQISDLHFGRHKQETIEAFLHQLKSINPEIILISGDLTQRATDKEYVLFSSFMSQLPGVILTIPGNHDVPLYPSQLLLRLVAPFKYYKHYVNQDIPVHFENDEVRIFGVNSVNPYRIAKGRLSKQTMSAIKTYFCHPFSGLSILFFHHNFDYLEGAHKPLTNYQELIDYVRSSNIDIICAGHSHYANVNIIKKNDNRSCIFLHAGSLTCTRTKDGINSFYLIEGVKPLYIIKLYCYKGQEYDVHAEHHFDLY